jgi:hypothetical protein
MESKIMFPLFLALLLFSFSPSSDAQSIDELYRLAKEEGIMLSPWRSAIEDFTKHRRLPTVRDAGRPSGQQSFPPSTEPPTQLLNKQRLTLILLVQVAPPDKRKA